MYISNQGVADTNMYISNQGVADTNMYIGLQLIHSILRSVTLYDVRNVTELQLL